MTTPLHILVTGAQGFIGTHLCSALRHHTHHRITTLSRRGGSDYTVDILDSAALQNTLSGAHFDVIIHLASPAKSSSPQPTDDETQALKNIIEHSQQQSAPAHCIFLTTSDEYGDDATSPQNEATPKHPMNPYGMAKKAAGEFLEDYAQTHAQPYSIVRPFSVYGPHQPEHMLISALLCHTLSGEPLSISAQEKVRDYVHVDDVCAALIAIAGNKNCYAQSYNIGTGVATSMSDMLALITSVTGKNPPITRSSSLGQHNPLVLVADITKARKELGYTPQISLHSGLLQTMEALSD